MYKKDQRMSLLFIGIGIGMCIAGFLLFSVFYVYIDIASADDRVGMYYNSEGIDNNDAEMKESIMQNQNSYMGYEELGTYSGIKSEPDRIKENGDITQKGELKDDSGRAQELHAGS